jgi:hypothetical protein
MSYIVPNVRMKMSHEKKNETEKKVIKIENRMCPIIHSKW